MKHRNQAFTELREPATPISPIENRKYTMTHSDDTGDLFVVIGTEYAEDKINATRDEVRLEWIYIKNTPVLYGTVLIDGEGISPDNAQIRETIFKREMPLALQAIYSADQQFFNRYPQLRQAPVLIHFNSTQLNYDKLYDFDNIGKYETKRGYR